MIPFLEKLAHRIDLHPDRAAVVDRRGKRETSYRELGEISDRIAAYLIEKGMGAEDVVVIRCDRSVEYVAAYLGIMKAGAAWVGVEEMMGEERIQYILKDSQACLVFDHDAFEEAMGAAPLPPSSYADPDPHQMAFIIYTSGSTGTPKGAVQEYGVYEAMVKGTRKMVEGYDRIQFANNIPETFIGGIYLTVGCLEMGYTQHMLPLSMLRNPKELLAYFQDYGIEMSFMPPTLAASLLSADLLSLKLLHVGGEIVSNVYTDRFPIRNIYGPTEFGYPTCIFELDHAYANTPIGYPTGDTRICLIDEKGQVLEGRGKEGILCVHLPYFRGYLGQDRTSDSIVYAGRSYYKTGDLAALDDRGSYTILGRADRMIKINGNRIDPTEVEAALKKVLDTDFMAVRMVERGGISFLCAYHTLKENPDPVRMAEELKARLPEYMFPSCYVHLDKIPLLANGKIDRKRLPEPADEILFSSYQPPVSDSEARLCRLFEEVLHIGRGKVGRNDDFFLLGGNSMQAIEMLLKSDIPGLSIPLIYRERRIKEIACALQDPSEFAPSRHWESRRCDSNNIGEEFKVPADDLGKDRGKEKRQAGVFPLTVPQEYIAAQEMVWPGQLLYNLNAALVLKHDTDTGRLKEAVKAAFRAHPSLLTSIRREKDRWIQQLMPDFNTEIEEEHVREEDLDRILTESVQPFFLDGSPLFRRKIIITPDRILLWMDVHHIICDGISLRILAEDIMAAYGGSDLVQDCYYDLVKEYDCYRHSAGWQQDRDHFNRICQGSMDRLPRSRRVETVVRKAQDHPLESLNYRMPFLPDYVSKKSGRLHMTPGSLYLLAIGLSMAVYNEADDVLYTWTWSGRGDSRTIRAAGLLFRDIPIALHLKEKDRVRKLMDSVLLQVREGITHSRCSYFMEKPEEKLMCFLYQGDFVNLDAGGMIEEVILPDVPGFTSAESLEVKMWEDEGSSLLELCYDGSLYEKSDMESFAKIFETVCLDLLEGNPEKLTWKDIRIHAGMACGLMNGRDIKYYY